MNAKGIVAIAAGIVLLVLVSATIYIVPETHRGVLLRFGSLIKTDVQPGLHFKLPWVDVERTFDVRVLTLNIEQKRYLTVEKKPLDVDSYVTWRIRDVDQFYRATGGQEFRAESLLTSRIDNGLRNEFGVRTMREVVSGQRDELMNDLTKEVNKLANEEFGLEILDIRVKGIELPQEVSQNVFRRMRTEREKEAQEHRSRGNELAEGIRADADRQATVLVAEAFRMAEEMRGEGDQIAAQTFADAAGQDPEFFGLYRSLRAYQEVFNSKDDLLVLDSNSRFLRFLKSSQPEG